jgi:hypothetical protein
MREPIILEADDGFHFMATRRLAEVSLEAIDIEAGVYAVYDADGFKLHLAPAPNGAGVISAPAIPESCSEQLAPKLREYLARVGIRESTVSTLSFAALVALAVERLLEREREPLGSRLRRVIRRLFHRG